MRKTCLIFLALAAALLLPYSATAADAVGRIISVEGTPKIERNGGLIDIKRDDPVQVGDTIRTGNGRAKILFQDNSIMTLGQQTDLKITEFLFQAQPAQRSSMFDLLGGKVKTLVGKLLSSAPNFQVRTPTAVAGVRGTYFQVDFEGDTEVTVFDGEVDVQGAAGDVVNLVAGDMLKGGAVTKLSLDQLNAKQNELAMRAEDALNKEADKKVDRSGFARRAVDGVEPLPGQGSGFLSIDSNSNNTPDPAQNFQSVDPAQSGNVDLQLQFPAERR